MITLRLQGSWLYSKPTEESEMIAGLDISGGKVGWLAFPSTLDVWRSYNVYLCR